MVIKSESDVLPREVERAKRVYIQWLIDRTDGSKNLEMRKFTILPGGEIPLHKHPDIEHVQYVLKGRYTMRLGDEEVEVRQGYVTFIPPETVHGYWNRTDEAAEFLCIIPKVERYETIWIDKRIEEKRYC
ncbi:MAG: cupin domain-containing protein [Aigarchaeota archaeon]|nr:cupin domain-containing protein [Aigarchaeota archaeon]MDW8092958.1 cupin domain-containing protein [Nitrososphaerota archaeon]